LALKVSSEAEGTQDLNLIRREQLHRWDMLVVERTDARKFKTIGLLIEVRKANLPKPRGNDDNRIF
jgi:hypothetical protein